MILGKFTVMQLIIAAGKSRRLDRSEICRISTCTQGYITKLLDKPEFNDLVKMFDMLPPDNDTKIYNGLSTVMMDVGRLIYLHGEKLSG
jgi:hypothetical protein